MRRARALLQNHAHAKRTTVPVENTKTEIERTLTRYGADRFAYFVEPKGAAVLFEMHGRRLRFNLPLGDGTSAKAERSRKQRWRALLLCIKAKLESVASNIETFEEAFLAHVVMPDNRTVYGHTAPQIAKGGEMQPVVAETGTPSLMRLLLATVSGGVPSGEI